MTSLRARERGFSLLLAIAVVALVGMAVMVTSEWLLARTRELRMETREVTLVALSDAALAETLAALAEDPSFAGVRTRRFAEGTIASEIVRPESGPLQIRAEAQVNNARAILRASVVLEPWGPRIASWERRVLTTSSP